MANIPVYLTTEQLLDVIDDIRLHIVEGDSLEGSIEYLMPWHEDLGDPETDPPGGFRVKAAYRVGNQLGGQGGMRMVGKIQ